MLCYQTQCMYFSRAHLHSRAGIFKTSKILTEKIQMSDWIVSLTLKRQFNLNRAICHENYFLVNHNSCLMENDGLLWHFVMYYKIASGNATLQLCSGNNFYFTSFFLSQTQRTDSLYLVQLLQLSAPESSSFQTADVSTMIVTKIALLNESRFDKGKTSVNRGMGRD